MSMQKAVKVMRFGAIQGGIWLTVQSQNGEITQVYIIDP